MSGRVTEYGGVPQPENQETMSVGSAGALNSSG